MAEAAQVAMEKAEVPTEESAAPKVSRRKLIIIVAAASLLLLAVGGSAAWFFMKASSAHESDDEDAPVAEAKSAADAKGKGKGKAKENVKDRKPSAFMNLDTFTVNLQSEGNDRFLQTTIVFELSDEKTAELIRTQMPIIRSRILLLLSSKNPAELNSLQGKDKLAEEIITEARKHFNSKPPDQGLLQVHFNAFVIQ